MPLVLSAHAARRLTAACPADAAFAFLCDVPACARLFPLLAEIGRAPSYDRGADLAWQTVLRPQGPPPFAVEPIYVCRYHVEPGARQLSWSPVEQAGNTRVSGWCEVADEEAGARVTLDLTMDVTLSAPRLARHVVQAAVRVGFEAAVSVYVERIRRYLEAQTRS